MHKSSRYRGRFLVVLSLLGVLAAGPACGRIESAAKPLTIRERVEQYAPIRLTADLTTLTENERRIIPLLIEAAQQMDRGLWLQAYGDRDELLRSIGDSWVRRFAEINYGPWDRLNNHEPFAPGIGPRPAGANFYPHDMTKAEFEAHLAKNPGDLEAFKSQYTVIRRGADGRLIAVPYQQAFAEETRITADRLKEAAAFADDPAFRRYLELRAAALLSSEYRESDLAWMNIKDSRLDCIIGPIEHYEDELFGYKTTYQGMVLVKDREWSERLAKFLALLPALQRGLPVPEAYKAETPGVESGLGVFDAIFCAGDANAGGKGIAVNLPNDEKIQLEKGARRLQFRNIMRAKQERIDVPIARLMVVAEQQPHVTFDAFFQNVLFHEVAHGLGVKNTINGRGPAREALKERFAALEEAKSDMTGLHIVAELRRQGQITDGEPADNYVSYLADIMRLARWGANDTYGQTTMLIFNWLKGNGAVSRDAASGTYRVDPAKMPAAVDSLVARIITLQGDGDYAGAKAFVEKNGRPDPQLMKDLERLGKARIPVDVVFEQGPEVLGLSVSP